METWKPTLFEGYEVSNQGKVRSVKRTVVYKDGRIAHFEGKILKPTHNKKGYQVVYPSSKYKMGYKTSEQVHRIVAETFIPNPENKPQINHKDGNKDNNAVSNLEWVTNLENHIHKLTHGLYPETHMPKRVGQYDKDNNLIHVYSSLYEAAKVIGTSQYSISRVANGLRKSCKGFLWRFV